MKLTKAKNVTKESFEKLLTELHSCLKPSETAGSFAIEMERYDSLFPLLTEVTRFPETLHKTEVSGAISKAVIATRKDNNTSLENFFETLGRFLDEYVALPLQDYTMWTKLHIHGPPAEASYLRFKIDDVRLVLRATLPRNLSLGPHFAGGVGTIEPNEPHGGMFLIARGRAKTDTQAGDALSQAMEDLVIALNFPFLSRLYQVRFGRDRPYSQLLMGPYQFFFGPRLKRDDDRIWYTPEFSEEDWRSTRKSFAEVKSVTPWVRDFLLKIKDHPCRRQLRRALRLLGDGWASPRASYRLLRSWTAVEALFSENPERADGYETIVRRASFLAKNPEIRRWKLRHAALVRNRFVHDNREGIALENIAGDLERYICAIVNWLVFKEPALTHERFLNFVDQPTSIPMLRQRKEDAEKAIALFEGG